MARMAARGDANLILRNVVASLHQDTVIWPQFIADLHEVYPSTELVVDFDAERDDKVRVGFKDHGTVQPLEGAGTGLLQTCQIFGYLRLFRPALALLDEPDAHLHPDRQRALCSHLIQLAEDLRIQVILSTHSRHVVAATRAQESARWLSAGNTVAEPADITAALMEMGALDSYELLGSGEFECLVLTEDTDPRHLELVLRANGFDGDRTLVVTYDGAGNVNAALTLIQFVRKSAPSVKVIVHRDRDYASDDAVQAFSDSVRSAGGVPWTTSGSDVEFHLLNADHLAACNPELDKEHFESAIDVAIDNAFDRIVEKIANNRINEAHRLRARGGAEPNAARITLEAQKELKESPRLCCHGKITLKALRQVVQNAHGFQLKMHQPTPHIRDQALEGIAAEIWPSDTSRGQG